MEEKVKPDARAERPKPRKPDGLARRLRREVYKGLPAATWSLVQQVDPAWSSAQTVAYFEARQDAGVDSRGASLAMQTACAEHDLKAWCYEFGDQGCFTHMMVLVEEEPGRIILHDPYLDLEGDGDLFDILRRIDADEAVELKGGVVARTYVVEASLEDAVAREWLGVAEASERGLRIQSRGGLAFLEGTSPGFRALTADRGKSPLAALLALPVTLLNPRVDDGAGDLAERLGLIEGPAVAKASSRARPLLAARRGQEGSASALQAQLAGILEQISLDRSRLSDELRTLQSHSFELRGELAIAQTSLQQLSASHDRALQEVESRQEEIARLKVDVDLYRADERKQSEIAETYREEASRLVQVKAELDDVRAEAQGLAETLRLETDARQRAEAAVEFREELSQLTAAVLAGAEERQSELEGARAEIRRLVDALSASEAEGRAAVDASASYQAEVARLNAQLLAAADDRQRELDLVREEVRQLAEARTSAEADARSHLDSATRLQAEVSQLTERLLTSAEEHRRETDRTHAEVRRMAETLSAAQAESRVRAEAVESARQDSSQMKVQMGAALAEAGTHREQLRQAKLQLDSVEGELRHQLAAALKELEQVKAAMARPPAIERAPVPHSVISLMTAGGAGVVLPEGSIGARGRQAGCLCYGPYIDLGSGGYRISMLLERPAFARLLPSQIVVEVVDGGNFLSRYEFRLRWQRKELTLDFSVPPSEIPRAIEFRILVGRNSYAKLRHLNLDARS